MLKRECDEQATCILFERLLQNGRGHQRKTTKNDCHFYGKGYAYSKVI
jgi:hypothetical protein